MLLVQVKFQWNDIKYSFKEGKCNSKTGEEESQTIIRQVLVFLFLIPQKSGVEAELTQ